MRIKLNIDESSVVEVVPCDNCEAIQGECCVTVLELNFPETIKGYSIDNYTKYIEFAECVEVGPCVKFLDKVEDNEYELKEPATNFRKIKIQLRLAYNEITWKSKIFELEFSEAINAEGEAAIQSQLLSLKAIEEDLEEFITANCFTVIYKVSDVPTPNANTLNKTIFYLGTNTAELTYGHYYRCVEIDSVYKWSDLTQDPSLADVANGIREVNKSRTMQVWVGTKEELENETPQSNVAYIIEDHDIKTTFDEVLSEMAEDEEYNLAYPITNQNGLIKYQGDTIALKNITAVAQSIINNQYAQVPILGTLVTLKFKVIFAYATGNSIIIETRPFKIVGTYDIELGSQKYTVGAAFKESFCVAQSSLSTFEFVNFDIVISQDNQLYATVKAELPEMHGIYDIQLIGISEIKE